MRTLRTMCSRKGANVGDIAAVADKLSERASRMQVAGRVLHALGERANEFGVLPMLELQVLYARAVVEALDGNKSRAARALGISRRALYRWLARGAA